MQRRGSRGVIASASTDIAGKTSPIPRPASVQPATTNPAGTAANEPGATSATPANWHATAKAGRRRVSRGETTRPWIHDPRAHVTEPTVRMSPAGVGDHPWTSLSRRGRKAPIPMKTPETRPRTSTVEARPHRSAKVPGGSSGRTHAKVAAAAAPAAA